MGYYINPVGQTKEEFLRDHGVELDHAPDKYRDGDMIAVVLVRNAGFTAAAIAWCPEELVVFTDERDHRAKKWFYVQESDLSPFFPTKG